VPDLPVCSGRLFQWGKLYRNDTSEEAAQYFGVQVNLPGMQREGRGMPDGQKGELISESHRSYYAGDLKQDELAESDRVTNFGTFVPCI
jgi:hypothetical protein